MKKIHILLFLFISLTCLQAQVTYTGKPMYKIDIKRGGTFLGSVIVELFPNIAYHHVRNFDSLVSVQFYDSTAFHRVIPDFMIQGGDPNSRHGTVNTWGNGQPGQPTVNAEFSAAKHLRGILSAARSTNINSATSQFFICVVAYPSLNNNYSVYGRVVSGMQWVDTTVMAPRNSSDRPNIKHEMFITAVGSNDTVPVKPNLVTPVNGTMAIDMSMALLLKWGAVSDGIIYSLEVAKDSLFTDIFKSLKTGNLSTYITSGLEPDLKYYWRVKVNNGGHYSPWSDVWTFDTHIDAVGLSENSKKGSIHAFPNPSGGKFTISDLESGETLEVYDAAGKLVTSILVKDGNQLVDLEGRDKGVYSFKVNKGDKEVAHGKLILK